MTIAIVPEYHKVGQGFSRAEEIAAMEHPGRRTNSHGYQSAAAWLSDLVALKKTILLCSFCRVKFNPRKIGYRKFYIADPTGHTDGYAANGKCDCCKQFTANCGGGTAFVSEELYPQVCIDPMSARREARARAGALTAWQQIQRQHKGKQKCR